MFCINLFFIYAFLGFIFESGLTMIIGSNFNSGILYGPWTFIYGIAIFVIMFLDKMVKKLKWKKYQEVLLFILLASIVMSLIEFSGGFIIEKWFHKVYWDYTNMKFNMGYYVCLEAALFWGVFATLINYLVVKPTKAFARKVPKAVTIIVMILFVVDIIATIVN